VIIGCWASVPAPDGQVAAEVWDVLERRGQMKHPPVTMAVSDPVALGIASLFRSPTRSGQVLDRFCRKGTVDSAELLQAAREEQQFASPEGHAALHCLIGWVHARVHKVSAGE
jgi:hypothetical protein